MRTYLTKQYKLKYTWTLCINPIDTQKALHINHNNHNDNIIYIICYSGYTGQKMLSIIRQIMVFITHVFDGTFDSVINTYRY